MFSKNERRGFLAYVTAASMWALNGSISKTLLDSGISAARLSQLRVTSAFLILLVFITLTNRQALKFNSKREFWLIAAYGIAGITMTQWLYFVAIHLLPVGVALVLEFTAPLMVVIWTRFAWNHQIRSTTWLGLAVAIGGLVLITELWSGFALDGLGVLAALGAAAALAVYFLAGAEAMRLPKQRDPLSMTMWGFGMATVFWFVVQPWWSFPWEYLQGSLRLSPDSTAFPTIALILYMVLLGTVLPFWLTLVAMKYLTAAQASATGMTEPVLASIVAWLLLGELLSLWQVIGCVVTLSGIFIAELGRRD